MAALIIAALALVVSGVSVVFARRAAHAAQKSAHVAAEQDKRSREPQIVIEPEEYPRAGQTFYTVRNDGPADLDAVLVYHPITLDGITYPVRLLRHPGTDDWAKDEVDLGPLRVTEQTHFALGVGPKPLEEYRVRVVCRAGDEEWPLWRLLRVPIDPSTQIF